MDINCNAINIVNMVIVIYVFYGIWIKQSSAMIFTFNLDKVLLKKLLPTIQI